ncbi:MAG: protein kinase [Lachnospiraceae bacterium]|nr:protein kinase [Candidatus Merdinaster equi]
MELQKGTRIKNRYEIVSELGKGGFGITYKAIDHLVNRFVAIKCSENNLSHEARVLKTLDNVPNISHIYDYFVTGKNHFLVMKLIQGKSLSAYRAELGGTIGINILKELLPSALITLDQMHERGIIHRDISPGNFLVSEDNRLVLIDFGSATSTKENSLKSNIIFNHKGLEAPENNQLSEIGSWTDIYSLCVTIVYLLTGEGLPSPEDRMKYDSVPSMLTRLSLTSKMQNALMHGLSLDKNKRYQSVQLFADEFYGRKNQENSGFKAYSVHYHARTDIGTRDVNQDNFMIDKRFAYAGEDCEIKGYIDCEPDELHVVAVADGVASSNHGELAAKAAIQAVSHFIDNYRNEEGVHETLVEELLNQINEKIIILGEKIGKTATTISILLWKNDKYWAANIGDSPIYQLRGDLLEMLSEEHTVAREKIDAGENVSPRDLHTLTKYLGKKNVAGGEMVHIKAGLIDKGDVFLICSDGIKGVVSDADIKKYLKRDGDKTIASFYKKAHRHEQMDNCSAVILKF